MLQNTQMEHIKRKQATKCECSYSLTLGFSFTWRVNEKGMYLSLSLSDSHLKQKKEGGKKLLLSTTKFTKIHIYTIKKKPLIYK